jgi:hypothetical protein
MACNFTHVSIELKRLRTAAAAGLISVVAGCGTTSFDEYVAIRSIEIGPASGDGTAFVASPVQMRLDRVAFAAASGGRISDLVIRE